MKNKIVGLLLSLLLVVCFAGSASAFGLNNWWFDPDGAGAGAKIQINEYFDIVSPNLVDTQFVGWPPGAPPAPGTFYTFDNYGVVNAPSYDGGGGFGTGFVTGIYQFSGSSVLGGPVAFNSGTFDIYVDSNNDYADATASLTSIYGADNGTKIASFSVLSGSGFTDPAGLPNGLFSINYAANFILPGYFFMPDGTTDLASLPLYSWTLGYTTTNASHFVAANPPSPAQALRINELYELAGTYGYTPPASNLPPDDFFLSANGQFRINVVPEPSTMVLLGVGLIGLAGLTRRTLRKKS